ncbi:hypothetical protein C8R43DRAFT_1133244 [Mycena crocata]|nr:hypothetical protein C8R43DRAFT_1133244 [Mycena crocata]
MTVSSGAGLLQRENGSTVKHLDWVIPTCVPVGNYNLTFYETSTVDSQPVFTITAVPIPISNGSPSGACSDNSTVAPTLNTLQPQPQAAHPLAQSPFVGANNGTATGSSVGITTFSVGPGTLVLPLVLVAFGTLL